MNLRSFVISLFVASAFAFGADAQNNNDTGSAPRALLATPVKVIELYFGIAPGSEDLNREGRTTGSPNSPKAHNVVRPVLMYYPEDKASQSVPP